MSNNLAYNDQPLIVILGPTASGKTKYAIDMARRINGQIICADSRTVYRQMDIGTAKPTPAEQADVVHYGLDLVDPDQKFTLYDFQQYAKQHISRIRDLGAVPMLVGGSGLYIDAVIYDYQLKNQAKTGVPSRSELTSWTVDQLRQYVIDHDLPMPADPNNPRRLIRVIESGTIRRADRQLIDNTIVIGIDADRAVLKQRIADRCQEMLNRGLIDEVAALRQQYGDAEPIRRNLYGVIAAYLDGDIDEKDLIGRMTAVDNQLVRKQLIWWRNPRRAGDIMWRPLAQLVSELEKYPNDSTMAMHKLADEYIKFRTIKNN